MTHQFPGDPGRKHLSRPGIIGKDASGHDTSTGDPVGIHDAAAENQRFRDYYRRAQFGLIRHSGTSLELDQPKNCVPSSDGWSCRNGPYSVDINRTGEIRVKDGDWLSKYSAAIYNNFFHIHEFGRRNRHRIVEPVDFVDNIHTGETLYHLPTYYLHHGGVPCSPPPSGVRDKLDDAEKKKRVMDILSRQYELSGQRLETLSKAIDIVGKVDDAITLAQLAGLVAEGSVISSIGTVTSIAGVLLFPVGATVAILNAIEIGERTYGFRAIAYTTTAYAFSDNVVPDKSEAPDKSFVIRERIDRRGADAAELAALDQAWKVAKDSTWQNIHQTVLDRRVSGSNYRAYLRACGDDQKQKFCTLILKGFEGELKGKNPGVFDTWVRNYNVLYPN